VSRNRRIMLAGMRAGVAVPAIAICLGVSACATIRDEVNCDNADHLRKAALATLVTVERFCPIDETAGGF